MKQKLIRRLTAFALAVVLAVGAALPAGAVYELPITPSKEGETIYLVNMDSGEVLLDENSTEVRYIASLTKMMTGLLVLESGEDLEQVITVPDRLAQEFKDIQNANGSGMRLRVGEQIRLIDLLYGLLLPSANDAASVLADYFGGGSIDTFVQMMNERAAQLGCTATTFGCAHGLYDQGNVSTAQDLVIIAQACYNNERFMEIANTTSYTLPADNVHTEPREIKTSNLMLYPDEGYYRADISGIKTGFTTLAGRCYVTTAEHAGHRYALVILGAKKEKKGDPFYIYPEASAILDWAFGRYSDRTLMEKDAEIAKVPLVGCDESDAVQLVAAESLVQYAYEDAVLQVVLETPEELKAPIEAGEALGTAIISLDGTEVGRVALVSAMEYESALLKGGLAALALVPAVLLAVCALGVITLQLGHTNTDPVQLAADLVSGFRRWKKQAARKRAKAKNGRVKWK